MTREADNPMTGSDFDWMVSSHAAWGWKAPVKASVSGVFLLHLSPFLASIFPLFPQKRLILRLCHLVICPCSYVTASHRDGEKPGNEADKALYGKPRNLDWVTSAVILIQIFLILGRCCNNLNFSDISPQNSKVT